MNKKTNIEFESHRTGPVKSQSQCKLARKRLFKHSSADGHRTGGWFSGAGIAIESPWIQRHISVCPRCQRRFVGQVGEQATLFIADPSGNVLEFKAMADATRLFGRD